MPKFSASETLQTQQANNNNTDDRAEDGLPSIESLTPNSKKICLLILIGLLFDH